MANINFNQELNGIEISFEGKPEAATIEALKASGYRWHKVKKLWYAKQTPERVALAESLTDGQPAPVVSSSTAAEVINLDNLGIKPANFSYHGADLAKLIREDLKKRGVKGVTVRSDNRGYTTRITVTVKASQSDFASLEEYQERYNFSAFSCDASCYRGVYVGNRWIYSAEWETMTEEARQDAYINHCKYYLTHNFDINVYHTERENYPALTTAFYNKVVAILKIANQWNYNNSDIMTDYFDVGYYLNIDIKAPESLEVRESMTDAERKAYADELEKERQEREEAFKRYEEERKQAEEEAKKRKAWEEEARERINNNIQVVDLAEAEKIYITNLFSGIGKECNLDEVRESIAEREASPEDAEITRKLLFTDKAAFTDFCKMFLYDFEFLANKGGSGSVDTRLPENLEPWKLNTEQRESVKFYICDAIAVYFNNDFQFVIDPEGYSYARYIFMPTDSTEIRNAAEELKKQEEESKYKPAFYFPESVEKQADALHIGQEITIYQCDGWILNSINGGAGIVTGFYISDYAQYKNCLFIELMDKRGRITKTHIRNDKECLIYEGIKPTLPESVTCREIRTGTGYSMKEMFNYNELIPNTYDYYKSLGEYPIIDTWQR